MGGTGTGAGDGRRRFVCICRVVLDLACGGGRESMAGPRIVNTLWPNWEDVSHGQAQTGWTTADQAEEPLGPYGGLLAAAIELSQTAMMNATFQRRMLVESSAVSGDFSSVRDQVVFQMQSENYTRLIAIPGPKTSIFIPGSVNVDMANPLVVAFLAQVFAVLGDSYGSPWLRCSAGWRRRVKIGGV